MGSFCCLHWNKCDPEELRLDGSPQETHLGQGHIGNNDGVESAGGVAQGLVLVAVGVVLVLVHLAIILIALPWHGRFTNTDVALGGDGSGLASKVPVILRTNVNTGLVPPLLECISNPVVMFGYIELGSGEGTEGSWIYHPASRATPDMTPRRTLKNRLSASDIFYGRSSAGLQRT